MALVRPEMEQRLEVEESRESRGQMDRCKEERELELI